MKVIHIIPSAFDYFNDIRTQAFSLLEELHKLGVENEAITLQYGQPNRAIKKSVQSAAPVAARNYLGNFDISGVIKTFADFDAVHLHCPFFGAAGKILRWAKTRQSPLVITYYRPVLMSDFFSIIILAYNWFYLARLFKLADSVIDMRQENLSTQDIAVKTALVYNSL